MTGVTPSNASSDLPPWLRKLLLGFFVLGVIPFAVYGVYRQIVTARDVMPVLEEQLLAPYVEALAAGDFEKARAVFTTEAYRERVGLEEYRTSQRMNQETYGPPKAYAIHLCNETKEPGRPWFIACEIRYEGTKGEAPLSVEFVEQEGKYLIDQTYLRQLDSRTEAIF